MSEMYCTRLARNTGCKNDAKKCHLRTIAQLRKVTASQLSHGRSEKNLLNSNIFSTCPHNTVSFDPPAADISWRVWGAPTNFNCFRVLASLLQRHRSTESTKLCTMFGCLLGWYTIYTFSWALALDGILQHAKFTLRPSLAFSYIGSVTAGHNSSSLAGVIQTLRRGTRNEIMELSHRAPPIFGCAVIKLGIDSHSR